MDTNKISIITICYNNLNDLLFTCKSIDFQFVKAYEHLIIDGSLTSEIRNHLNFYPQPDYRSWISEKDNGIADAFNKGILKATGNILLLLNAGDKLFDENVIASVADFFNKNENIQWVHGKYMLNRGNQWVIIGKKFEKSKLYRGMRSICHQTMYIKKEMYSKYGLYNSDEKIAMDYDLLCRIADEPFDFISKPLALFGPGGISTSAYLKSLDENKKIYEKYFGKSVALNLWQIRLKILHLLLTSKMGNFLYKIKIRLKLENI